MLLFKLTSAKKLVKDGFRNVCLLRAKITLTKQFYVEGLRKFIIEAIIPNRNGIEEVNSIIYDKLTKGIIRKEFRKRLLLIAKKLIDRGAEAIALAYTELPHILKNNREKDKVP